MPPLTISVPLRFDRKPLDPKTGSPLPVPTLDFALEPHGMSQPRLRGLVARPALKLWGAYRPTARLDWLRLGLNTRDATQSRWISERLGRDLPRGPHVTGRDGRIGHSGREFLITLQDPTPPTVARARDILRDERGLVGPVTIEGMEVAIDFHPVDESDAARWLMVELLAKVLAPPPEMLREDENRARWSHGRSARFFVYAREPKVVIDGVEVPAELDPSTHHRAPVDRTRYFGERGCGRMIRVQDKISDAKNPDRDGGDGEPLSQSEKRARIEVELLPPFDGSLKISELDDLRRFKFQDLRKRYFNFWLPTFDSSGIELDRRSKIFSRTGNYGLARHDQCHRSVWPERSKPPGLTGDRIVCRELHDMARDSLRKLNRPWGGAW